MQKYIKYLLILVLSLVITACAMNRQKSDAKILASKVDSFRTANNTSIEFLSFINISKDYSYVVDNPVLVEKLIAPNIAIVNFSDNSFAIEFSDKELTQSYPLLKVGAKALFQEGILISGGNFLDKETGKSYKIFRICRSEDCRSLARTSITYMYKWSETDASVPKSYQIGSLNKFLVDQAILGKPKATAAAK